MKKNGRVWVAAMGAWFSMVACGAAATHGVAPGEEMYDASANDTVKSPAPAPKRGPEEGLGPYKRLIIRGATLVDGTGAPPVGPVDFVIENDRIARIASVGFPKVPIRESGRPASGEYEIDATGMYVLPGFINAHAHIADAHQGLVGTIPPAEYVYKLWLGHGITTVRETGSFYGLQDYPVDYNYSDESDRFGQAGRLWAQAAPRGSERWKYVLDTLRGRDFTQVPTFTIYEASRDLMREQRAEWHDEYTLPTLMRWYTADREAHGAYWFHWTTADEIAWKQNYQRWMSFVNDYKNAGGRVAVGDDAGFIYKLFGFAWVRELELLQEAGFHPLEVVRSATLSGAELLGMADRIGSIEAGKNADLVIVAENPLANFKVLYGTGAQRLNDATGKAELVGGVKWTIHDGIIYDSKALLADVRKMVSDAKTREAAQPHVTQSGVIQPAVPQPPVAQTPVAQADGVQPTMSQSTMPQPTMPQPLAAQLGAAQ